MNELIRDYHPNPSDASLVIASIFVHCIWQYRPPVVDHSEGVVHLETSLLSKVSGALLEISGRLDHTRKMVVFWLSNASLLRHFVQNHQCMLPAEHNSLSELRTAMSRYRTLAI